MHPIQVIAFFPTYVILSQQICPCFSSLAFLYLGPGLETRFRCILFYYSRIVYIDSFGPHIRLAYSLRLRCTFKCVPYWSLQLCACVEKKRKICYQRSIVVSITVLFIQFVQFALIYIFASSHAHPANWTEFFFI